MADEKNEQKRIKTPSGRTCLDITGNRYGWLTVLGDVQERLLGKCGKRTLYWKVRCDCGKEFYTYGEALKHGQTTSCGCRRQKERQFLFCTSMQLCWTCKKACGGYDCPWARKHDPEPVPGWKARKTVIEDGRSGDRVLKTNSYAIRECPLYEWDGKEEKHE